jgi:hypothetical protein
VADSRRREVEEREDETGRRESPIQGGYLEPTPLRSAVQPRNETPSGKPILAALPKMDPRTVTRLVDWTAASELG